MSVTDDCSREHSTVTVTVGDWSAEIDVDIAPLIREIWKAGIETMMSCQEALPGIAWIEFPEVKEILRFLNMVTLFEPGIDTLYNRINPTLTGAKSAPDWEYQFNLLDNLADEEEQVVAGLTVFDATVGVFFPVTDMPVLIDRLRIFNDASPSS